jgi:L-malate glycosyltransferase
VTELQHNGRATNRAFVVRDDEVVTPVRPTVLLATLNRAATLESVLDAYCRLDAPRAGWDLVVVDNGSTDRTKHVVESFSSRLPIRYHFEPTPGKNAALNSGLPLTCGDLVVFTDDDIYPRSDWLTRLCAAAESHRDFSVFCGIIEARWEVRPSESILRAVPLSVCYAIHNPGMHDGPSDAGHAFGGNVAIRREVFRQGYRFDPSFGPRPRTYTMAGETELILRLAQDGHKVWCCESAIVEHLVPSAHVTTGWILKRAERWGRARARLDAQHSRVDAPMVFGVPRWSFRAAAQRAANVAFAVLRFDRAALLHARWELQELRGSVAERRAMAKATHGVGMHGGAPH